MRVLLTGHQGYLGTEGTGLDSGLFADCILGGLDVPDLPGLATDVRDVTVDQLAGFDAVVHMAAYRERDLTPEAVDERYTRLAVLSRRQQAGELDENLRVVPRP